MGRVFALARKEIFSAFVSPVAYFIITGFVLIAGYFFFGLLATFNRQIQAVASLPAVSREHLPNLNQWVLEDYFRTLIFILVFVVPLLTMRSLAEERRQGTFELLSTLPLRSWEIVLGKFVGIAVLLLVMLGAAFVFPILLCIYGNPELLPVLSGIGGVIFCGFAFASVGLALSSFTENQVVAAMCAMVGLLLLYLAHVPGESLRGQAGEWLYYLSPVMQSQMLLEGVISLQGIIYFLSLIVAGLYITQKALGVQNWR